MRSFRNRNFGAALFLAILLLPVASMARFISIDPQAAKYPSLSPYVYTANNPMKYVDPSGEVLEKIWNDPVQRARHMNDAVPSSRFVEHARGMSLSQLQGPPASGNQTSTGVGPEGSVRYVIDPANSNQVIDMRHFLVVGQQGEAFGLAVELLQLSGDNTSAFDAQDFLSNTLGTEFFDNYYDPDGDIAEQLKKYFEDRAAQSEQQTDQEQEDETEEEGNN